MVHDLDEVHEIPVRIDFFGRDNRLVEIFFCCWIHGQRLIILGLIYTAVKQAHPFDSRRSAYLDMHCKWFANRNTGNRLMGDLKQVTVICTG
ncbi:hypothetical protein BH24BAC1_BH24BAC1_39880 [soil metagenome]